MSRRNHPSAFDISFQDDAPGPSVPRSNVESSLQRSSSTVLAKPPLKRKKNDTQNARPPKAIKLLPAAQFTIPPNLEYMNESATMRIVGEDEENNNEKRIRNLSNFTIYDPNHRNQIMSLSSLEKPDGQDCKFDCFGQVSASLENDEDEGQEADLAGPDIVQWVNLGPIKKVALDYTRNHAPLYIETEYAWYIVQMPSLKYKEYLLEFYLPHRIAQMMVSAAHGDKHLTRQNFIEENLRKTSLLDRSLSEDDMAAASPVICDVVEDVCREYPALRSVPVIKSYRANMIRSGSRTRLNFKGPRRHNVNVDIAVLEVENLAQTTVTPLVAKLSQPYIQENLRVAGPRPPKRTFEQKRQDDLLRTQAHQKLVDLIHHCWAKPKCKLDYKEERGTRIVKAITIDEVIYQIGDTVIVPIGHDPADPKSKQRDKDDNKPPLPSQDENIPENKFFEDYFWFARIIYIDVDQKVLHVQWLNHAKFTVIGDLGHTQELFLQAFCGSISVQSVVAKATVHYLHPDAQGRFTNPRDIPYGEYFSKFEYNPNTAVFTTIRNEFLSLGTPRRVRECLLCDFEKQEERKHFPEPIENKTALAFRGKEFHVFDYVLYRAQDGPGNMGQIIEFRFPSRLLDSTIVVVRKLGRMSSLKGVIPEDEMIDERELFFTEDNKNSNYDWIEATFLLQVCHVSATEFRSPQIENWILHGDNHFYVRYIFPSLHVRTWTSKKAIHRKQVQVCGKCHRKREQEVNALNEFLTYQQRHPLRALDAFGGSGALGMALAEGSSCFNITHAIEIAPSAAKTYQKNSPDTLVLNTGISEVVQYIVKKNHGIELSPTDIPTNKETGEQVEFSMKPEDIEVVIAGFPCQPHSTQNIYKNANDLKTNLILPLLSLIDHLRPTLIVLENVSGFLFCRLMGKQNGPHRVVGGIEQGALKLLIKELVEMGYQVRFSLLQAAHYGTPQGRVRFFMLASLPTTPLPELPQPTHYFPEEGVSPHLRINLANGRGIEPIRTAGGTMLFPMVTIADAISDLRQFDWKHPCLHNWSVEQRLEARKRKETVPIVPCTFDVPYWGLKAEENPYEHPSRSRFQLSVRAKTEPPDRPLNLQHYTRRLPLKTVERVVNIKLVPGSDFRSLPSHLTEFQYWNPASYVAKERNAKSLYKRLDANGYFSTTITNVSPTAKQSSVIHPSCRRLLTVRELLRSQGIPDHIQIVAIDDNVITMHRAIGNAVPWRLSIALGQELKKSLCEKWNNRDQIVID